MGIRGAKTALLVHRNRAGVYSHFPSAAMRTARAGEGAAMFIDPFGLRCGSGALLRHPGTGELHPAPLYVHLAARRSSVHRRIDWKRVGGR